MKKPIIILVAALLLASSPYAQAQSELLQKMWELYVASHETTEFADCFFSVCRMVPIIEHALR